MTSPDAVRAMLGARSVAVVGASARPGSFGERLVTEVLRSPSTPEVTLVNPRYDVVAGRPCVPSLRDLAEPVDLVLLAVNDSAVEEQLSLAGERGDRSALVFGSVWSPPAPGPSLRQRLSAVAEGAGMALCGVRLDVRFSFGLEDAIYVGFLELIYLVAAYFHSSTSLFGLRLWCSNWACTTLRALCKRE